MAKVFEEISYGDLFIKSVRDKEYSNFGEILENIELDLLINDDVVNRSMRTFLFSKFGCEYIKHFIQREDFEINNFSFHSELPFFGIIIEYSYPIEIIQMLLTNPNLNINEKFLMSSNWTYLTLAIYNNKPEAIKVIMDHPECDIKMPFFHSIKKRDVRPLEYAKMKNYKNCVKVIEEKYKELGFAIDDNNGVIMM
eukprot:TRINITY_DN6140_c0_g1_i1.p1 TRINITY_DN6140_c0_g1~~TRINITY_DN6140_c0_g1_i1.p1  ORF type:complete len:196 (-),score=29.30 TRINITY_DN6140_c0_g1_i1:294-881(-)